MIGYVELIGTPGMNYVIGPASVKPLCLCREGIEFGRIVISPGNRTYKYAGSTGKFSFQDAFSGDITGDRNLHEKVYVRYKY